MGGPSQPKVLEPAGFPSFCHPESPWLGQTPRSLVPVMGPDSGYKMFSHRGTWSPMVTESFLRAQPGPFTALLPCLDCKPVVQAHSGVLLRNEKDPPLLHATSQTDLKAMRLSDRRQTEPVNIQCDSTCAKSTEGKCHLQ